ncbi:hypothetical protein [Bacillus thuringiensis]|uniref:hypothetical protein n=1 Tax=Bacillus thuringiensis TaxID=1428 RepID=UPI0021D67ABD|nr:hypothetical protein [Bacillus thuringiensis]MCU7667078.1 hypothetical protein [Bacillus thuringiensis]
MEDKDFLDYVPLQFMDFDMVAVILIIGLLAAVVGFYCFVVGFNFADAETIKTKTTKKKRKSHKKNSEKIYIEEDDFAIEENVEVHVDELKQDLIIERTVDEFKIDEINIDEINIDGINIADINLEEIDLQELEKQIENEKLEVEMSLSAEDTAFLEELKKTLKDENDTQNDDSKIEEVIVNETEMKVSNEKNEDYTKIPVEQVENGFEISLKEKMKEYAQELKRNED